jgi:hypothetical protein
MPTDFTAFIHQPPPDPIFPGLPSPPTLAEPLPIVIFALAAAAIIDKPPRAKKEPKHKPEEANKRVMKIRDAYDEIDKVITSREIAIAFVKLLPAFWHIQSPHFPVWVDATKIADEISDEVTEALRNKLKEAMFKQALQQDNQRTSGKWSHKTQPKEFLFFPLKIRRGELHTKEFDNPKRYRVKSVSPVEDIPPAPPPGIRV